MILGTKKFLFSCLTSEGKHDKRAEQMHREPSTKRQAMFSFISSPQWDIYF
jgi:hypothetical protein